MEKLVYYKVKVGDGYLFSSREFDKCVEYIKTELRNRNKNDGNDEYWHNVPVYITEVKEKDYLFIED